MDRTLSYDHHHQTILTRNISLNLCFNIQCYIFVVVINMLIHNWIKFSMVIISNILANRTILVWAGYLHRQFLHYNFCDVAPLHAKDLQTEPSCASADMRTSEDGYVRRFWEERGELWNNHELCSTISIKIPAK